MDRDFAPEFVPEDDFEEVYSRQRKEERRLFMEGMDLAKQVDGLTPSHVLWDEITQWWGNDDWRAYMFYVEQGEATERGRHAPGSPVASSATTRTLAPHKGKVDARRSKRLSEIIEPYIAFHQTIAKPWAAKTSQKFRQQMFLFADFLGNPHPHEITSDMIRDDFSFRVSKWPMHVAQKKVFFNANGQRKTVEEILRIADDLELPRLSPNTVADHVKNAITFLNWLEDQEYIDKDFTRLLRRQAQANRESDVEEKGFNEIDLGKIFGSREYLDGSLLRQPERYWLPLIAVHTGARESEICQLHLDDISYNAEHGIWLIDFNANGQKQLKNKSSKRVCPIHKTLISLGFVQYVQHLKERGERQLFPNLKPDKYGHWGRKISRWFNGEAEIEGYLEKCGIVAGENERKNFHSFRHTVCNFAKQNDFDQRVIREITGHAVGKADVHSAVYEKGFDLANRKKAISGLKIPFDFTLIKPWR